MTSIICRGNTRSCRNHATAPSTCTAGISTWGFGMSDARDAGHLEGVAIGGQTWRLFRRADGADAAGAALGAAGSPRASRPGRRRGPAWPRRRRGEQRSAERFAAAAALGELRRCAASAEIRAGERAARCRSTAAAAAHRGGLEPSAARTPSRRPGTACSPSGQGGLTVRRRARLRRLRRPASAPRTARHARAPRPIAVAAAARVLLDEPEARRTAVGRGGGRGGGAARRPRRRSRARRPRARARPRAALGRLGHPRRRAARGLVGRRVVNVVGRRGAREPVLCRGGAPEAETRRVAPRPARFAPGRRRAQRGERRQAERGRGDRARRVAPRARSARGRDRRQCRSADVGQSLLKGRAIHELNHRRRRWLGVRQGREKIYGRNISTRRRYIQQRDGCTET